MTVAAEKCAGDTKGQTCYICTEALHWETKEGLVRMCSCRGTAGFVHVSCLAEQAKILCAEAEEKNKVSQWHRWHTCSLCEQGYHGVVYCALGWACWKTYVGRPEGHRIASINVLGNGLSSARHYEEALTVMEARLSMLRRLGAPENRILIVQTNLAMTYDALGRFEEALSLRQDVYSGRLKLLGGEHEHTLVAANNYAASLVNLRRFKEARSLLLKTLPVARRVLGENDETKLRTRYLYGVALNQDDAATLDELREAVTTLEDTERIARRVLGGAHPLTESVGRTLRGARAALGAEPLRDAVGAMGV